MEGLLPDATIEVQGDVSLLDGAIETAPEAPAVFLIWPREGSPYLARTNALRRRLRRLLGERAQPGRLLYLRPLAHRIEYRITASRLETSLVLYEWARRHFPQTYVSLLKLRMPPYVKLILSNRFPRCQITTRLSGARALYYGPFRNRASAEQFESRFLDLFQIRRCEEDLDPSPQHPGCIYGEMNLCLRPCQAAVTEEEYRSEVERVMEFLLTDGRSLKTSVTRARDRLSEELNFEEAARQHRTLEKIEEILRLRDELARDVERLHGVAVTRAATPMAVLLWFLIAGTWQAPRSFPLQLPGGRSVSLDSRLRDLTASLGPQKTTARIRQEHLALLARWYYSSFRDGEWIPFDSLEAIPYRRIVYAISRLARAESTPGS
jgi:excinuclease UvrABC nuclease subunit